MKNEIERKQGILQKVSKACRRIVVFVVCLVGVLIFLELFDVRIDLGNNHSIKLAVFILITGLFMLSDTLMVYLQTLNDGFTMRRLAWNLIIIWTSNVFVLCCTHNYIFGSSFSHILPTAVSAAFIIGGTQFMFFSAHILIRKLCRERNELQVINEMLRQQQEHDAMQSDDDTASQEEKQCMLHSDYNDQNITINPRNFIYVESVGNYAKVCHIANEQLTTTTLRTTIKQIKEDLSGNDHIVQCHRGFLVNLDYIESMEGTNGRFFLNLFYSDKKIPVSRAYKTTIKETLSSLQ